MLKRIEEFFVYLRSVRNAILILVFISLMVFVAPKVYLYFNPPRHTSNELAAKEVEAFIQEFNERKRLASLSDSAEDYSHEHFNPYASVGISSRFERKQKKKVTYFYFDPNKIGVEEWIQLGFSEKQSESIEKLKAKGFKFYQPEDLKKVYVIGEENYSLLLPYVKIEAATFQMKVFPETVSPEKPREKFVLDINAADSSMFERQRGIGPSLASRIIKYRSRLGGFISPEQIREVWGMPDSTYQSLKDRFAVNSPVIARINVNQADVSTMGKHPYINFQLAKVIGAYRKQHGNFKSVTDIKKVALVTDSIYQRLQPYIVAE